MIKQKCGGGGKALRANKSRVRSMYGASEGQLLSLSFRKQNDFRVVFPCVLLKIY